MPEPTRQRRTAASILEDIKKRILCEQNRREQCQRELFLLDVRITTLESVLTDAEQNGEAE